MQSVESAQAQAFLSTLQVDDKSLTIELRADGYVNAKRIGSAGGGKEFYDFNRLVRTEKLKQHITAATGVEALVDVDLKAGIGNRATWIHPELAPHFARWVLTSFGDKPLSGIVYAVTSAFYNAVKLGRWTGSLRALEQRYKTLLTSQMTLAWVEVSDAKDVETKLLTHFEDNCIGGEVHQKLHWNDYVEWLENWGQVNHNREDVKSASNDTESAFESDTESECSIDLQESFPLLLLKEKTKQRELEQANLKERNRQLELEIELAKLQPTQSKDSEVNKTDQTRQLELQVELAKQNALTAGQNALSQAEQTRQLELQVKLAELQQAKNVPTEVVTEPLQIKKEEQRRLFDHIQLPRHLQLPQEAAGSSSSQPELASSNLWEAGFARDAFIARAMLEKGNRERRAAKAKERIPRKAWTEEEIQQLANLLNRFKYKWQTIADMPEMSAHSKGTEIRDQCWQLRQQAVRAGLDLAVYLGGALVEKIPGKHND